MSKGRYTGVTEGDKLSQLTRQYKRETEDIIRGRKGVQPDKAAYELTQIRDNLRGIEKGRYNNVTEAKIKNYEDTLVGYAKALTDSTEHVHTLPTK